MVLLSRLLGQKRHTGDWFSKDALFNQVYPSSIRHLSKRHWTPLLVARKAAQFLAGSMHTKVLDIGSGVGKFCLVAGHHTPGAFFYGIEQRKSLVHHAEAAKELLQVNNVSFIHGNFTQVDFSEYDHFYFYNSFYENLIETGRIDDNIEHSEELYIYYNRYLYGQLAQRPAGTRLATFHCLGEEIPGDYHVVSSALDDCLRFWIKA